MKILKKIILLLIILFAILILGCYAFYLFILPNILASPENTTKYENFVSQKIGVPFTIKGLKVKTYPDLSFKISSVGLYSVTKNGETLAHIDNLKYGASLLNIKHGKLSSSYIYADVPTIKDNIKLAQNKEQKPLNLSFFPKTNVKKAYIKLTDKTYININYIKSKSHSGKIITQLLAKIYNPYTKTPVIIGEKGAVVYKNALGFEDFSLQLDDSKLYLTGGTSKLKITGKSIPVNELEKSFLYFYKLKNPNKRNFIENFSDFYGKLDVDLIFAKGVLSGTCTAHDLGAKFSNFKIPVHLPLTTFYFKDKTVQAKTKGTFGGKPVTTDFHLTGMMTHDLHVIGDVHSHFTNKITRKYFPMITIKGIADADVKYHTHNSKVDVYYTLKLNKGNNNLLSEYGNLDNTDKTRIITMHTVKQGNPMKIQDYAYSVVTSKGLEKIFYGSGMFNKINGHYKLTNIDLNSNGKVSIHYIKSFLKNYVDDGSFDVNLKLDVLAKKLDGVMNLYNITHGDFLTLSNAKLKIVNDDITLRTIGKFYGSPYLATAKLANDFNELLIRDIDVHLNSFYVQRGKLNDIQSFSKNSGKKNTSSNKKLKIDVEQGRVIVDRIYGRKFDVRSVNIEGSLKNNIAHFVIPKAIYAGGVLTAKGLYNLDDTSSDIQFFASDINSNTVATNFFNLPNQVTGKAFATLHVKMKNKLNDIKAKATFAITDGFLPKLSSQEFILGGKKKKNKKPSLLNKLNIKVSISKLVNIDFSKPTKDLYTNVYGSFDINNEEVSNIKLFSKNDMLSFFVEGNYDIDNQCGNLDLWGKSNKTKAKKIRILKIPINLIYKIVFKTEHTQSQYADKLKQIPPVKAAITDEVNTFRVSASGNLNETDHLKIILKNIK